MTGTIPTRLFHPIFVGLLALCLALAAADPQSADKGSGFGAFFQAILLDTLTAGAAEDLKNDDKRSRTLRSGQPALALPPYHDCLPPRASCFLPAHGTRRIVSCNTRASIAIRAPPLRCA